MKNEQEFNNNSEKNNNSVDERFSQIGLSGATMTTAEQNDQSNINLPPIKITAAISSNGVKVEKTEHIAGIKPGVHAASVIKARYSVKTDDGEPLEDWSMIVERVCRTVSRAEISQTKQSEFLAKMRNFMLDRMFIPNTPCLVNAGKPGGSGQLAACFVLQVEDSIGGIMEHAQAVAKIHQTGGGTGQSYEFLRPAGSLVNSTKGAASGPVSFMNIVNTATEVVKQGGVRRGANMGVMRVTHPDILRFIHAKNDQSSLTNFNISVTVTDKFMEAVDNKEWFQLEFGGKPWDKPIFDPVTNDDYQIYFDETELGWTFSGRYDGSNDLTSEVCLQELQPLIFADKNEFEKVKTEAKDGLGSFDPPKPGMVYAPDIWNRIIASAHKYAEPGVIFIDEVNRHNLLKNSMGEIYSCNPCAEQMLHHNNACNLGSIDVAKFFEQDSGKKYSLNWEKLREVVSWSVRFLDNVIDVCHWTLPEIEAVVKRTRPIGLGIMGFADLCLKLKIRYGSDESLRLMEILMRYIRREAWNASLAIGIEKGAFPEFKANFDLYKGFFSGDEMKPFRLPFPPMPRNYEVTTIAPTGTISLVAETSSGIEPNFSWAYVRRDSVGERFYVHPMAAEVLGIEVDYQDEESIKKAAEFVIENQHKLPDYFVTAMELSADQHIRILAAAQLHVDNSISKTCNGAADDTIEDVTRLYQLARELKCKAVSYYRDGSREGQVLTSITKNEEKNAEPKSEQNQTLIVKEQGGDNKSEIGKVFSTPARNVERPRELQGSTWNFEFAGTKLYVTVNHDGEAVREVFVAGFISNGVGILASTMLQSDCFTTEEVARKLDRITGINSLWFNERLLTSPEQAVAECLLIAHRRLNGQADGKRSALIQAEMQVAAPVISKPTAFVPQFKICPSCKENSVIDMAGCPTCQSCGFSKCS